MVELVECVPNVSEGRRTEGVEAIARAAGAGGGGGSHNRSVITFLGDRGAVAEAAFRCAREAVARIDMNVHRGEHPRVGALDVLPFVPIAGGTMDDCVAPARSRG